MGSSSSRAARLAQKRSNLIDHQLEEDCKRFKREAKILLLGSRNSGLRTIVKEMKIFQDGFSDTERAQFRSVVYRNVLDSAQRVLAYMKKTGLECIECTNRALAENVLNFRLDDTGSAYFPSEIAEAIYLLWNDSVFSQVISEHSSCISHTDSATYFLSQVLRIGSPHYLPSDTDILRANEESTGITETRLNMGQLSIHMFDVGDQRSERKKWIHCFENVTLILFCVDMSVYDQVSEKEPSHNKLSESFALFESVVNSQWFRRTTVVLFLNRIDVFKNKIPEVPLERYFPEYAGGPDVNKAAKYILWKFMQANRAQLPIHPLLTQPRDVSRTRLVFSAVKETILQNALKDSGVLGWPDQMPRT
ncbi:hypothetical protein GALMADRAFT_157398 [Galerina marginata CBS 339.88]|uniref:Guanine nucleotide-binding protein alpha-3 subunit n=1 Tax=Galerina marginata (strain CBS 339.88) TaxID=685588 RepID=A0A067T762_GALM3|nr:hypothetical protein GALMADRAFT_157398 [Galerina marginata CBS 339.88]